MKRLLFDQNLSPRLAEQISDIFPGSQHIAAIGLGNASDRMVWEYAREHDLVIVSKDADFSDMGLLRELSPKVIWIRRGNCSTREIELLLRSHVEAISAFGDDANSVTLILF